MRVNVQREQLCVGLAVFLIGTGNTMPYATAFASLPINLAMAHLYVSRVHLSVTVSAEASAKDTFFVMAIVSLFRCLAIESVQRVIWIVMECAKIKTSINFAMENVYDMTTLAMDFVKRVNLYVMENACMIIFSQTAMENVKLQGSFVTENVLRVILSVERGVIVLELIILMEIGIVEIEEVSIFAMESVNLNIFLAMENVLMVLLTVGNF